MEGDEAVEGLLVHVGRIIGVLTSVLAFGDLAVEAHLLGNDLQINTHTLYRHIHILYSVFCIGFLQASSCREMQETHSALLAIMVFYMLIIKKLKCF